MYIPGIYLYKHFPSLIVLNQDDTWFMPAHLKSSYSSCRRITDGMQQHIGFGLPGCLVITSARGCPPGHPAATRHRHWGLLALPVRPLAELPVPFLPAAPASLRHWGWRRRRRLRRRRLCCHHFRWWRQRRRRSAAAAAEHRRGRQSRWPPPATFGV